MPKVFMRKWYNYYLMLFSLFLLALVYRCSKAGQEYPDVIDKPENQEESNPPSTSTLELEVRNTRKIEERFLRI